jgi:hypothetical protein
VRRRNPKGRIPAKARRRKMNKPKRDDRAKVSLGRGALPSQAAQIARIAVFTVPLLMSSAALAFEMNVNPNGVRGEGPCTEASEPCFPRQTRSGGPGVSPALSDVLGRGNSSHPNGNNAGELHWIYSEGYQTNYPNTGSGLAVQSRITTAAGTAVIYTDGTATFTFAGSSDATVPVDVYGIAGQGVGIFFSNGTAYFVPPAPGSNLGNIVADKNRVVKGDDAN